DVPVTYSGTGSVANSSKYQDLTDFYENADLEAYGSDWTFTEGLLPHLGEFVEEFVVHNEALEIAQSSTVTLSVSSKYGHYLELKNGQAGVSLNGNDLSVEDVEIGTEIVIQIKSNYVSDVQEFTFIVVG
ncbi:MAG TPA: hypothetical protein GX692_04430, partial [Acholeplasmataceae bacterium]|nr:hypothetical protein [Acholeplasmataceae bacterium]